MQDVDDFESFISDPIEDGVARPYEVAAQPGCELISRPATERKLGKTIEASHDAVDRAIRGIWIIDCDGAPDLCQFYPGGGS